MGCVESKKTIEAITERDIKLVCNLDVCAESRTRTGGLKELLEPRELRSDDATTTTTTTSLRKGKSKLKYDPRVTAKYEFKGTLGDGSFTSVVWVENRQTRKPYAIKIYDAKEGKEAFEAELSILRRVKSPYVIKLIEVFENVDRMYMVMELATGGSLMDRILDKGPCTEREAVRVLKMILEGVRYLHHLGITHRDLKPDNMLFYHPGKDSRLMITDFGVAHARGTAEATHMDTVCGTPEYIAPEMVLWRPYTNAVDLWAAGVVCYVILRGDFPFYHANRSRLYKKILKGSYAMDDEVWQKISASGRDFVSRLIEVDPEARLTATEALAHPWLKAHHRHNNTPTQQDTSESRSCRSSHSSLSRHSTTSLRGVRGKVRTRDLPHHNHNHNHNYNYHT